MVYLAQTFNRSTNVAHIRHNVWIYAITSNPHQSSKPKTETTKINTRNHDRQAKPQLTSLHDRCYLYAISNDQRQQANQAERQITINDVF